MKPGRTAVQSIVGSRRQRSLVAVMKAGIVGLTFTGAAHAAFPDHPLTLVVPYPPGGVADMIARPLAQELGKRLRQPVIVDNRAGANGNIGSTYVAKLQPADGYTLLLGSASTLTINPHLYQSIGHNPKTDLQPLTLTHQMPNVLVAGVATPYTSVDKVIAEAKARPGAIAFGSAGMGNTMHLAGMIFQQQSGIKLLHVPYKGGAPALNDVLAGQIPLMFNNLPAVVNFAHEGKVKVLAIADAKRSPTLSSVPTMAETGVAGVVSVVWNGLLVRRGTPPAVAERLGNELRAILASPEFRAPLEAQGYEILSSTPAEFEALIEKDLRIMGTIVKQVGIVPE